jgi:spermidine/putrescine transport system permease protein
VDGYTVVRDFNLTNYAKFFGRPLYTQVLWNSLLVAAVVTIASTLVGYGLAFFLVFVSTTHRNLLYLLVIVPLWSSFLLRAFTWKLILGREGIINSLLQWSGLTSEPISLFLYNRFSVCLTLSYIFIPFVTLPVFTALEKIPRAYIEASIDLGGSMWQTFRHIILPLSLPGLIAGATFTFALSFGDFVTPALLGGPSSIMISNVIIGQFGAAFDWPFGSAIVVVMVAVILGVVGMASLAERRRGAPIV